MTLKGCFFCVLSAPFWSASFARTLQQWGGWQRGNTNALARLKPILVPTTTHFDHFPASFPASLLHDASSLYSQALPLCSALGQQTKSTAEPGSHRDAVILSWKKYNFWRGFLHIWWHGCFRRKVTEESVLAACSLVYCESERRMMNMWRSRSTWDTQLWKYVHLHTLLWPLPRILKAKNCLPPSLHTRRAVSQLKAQMAAQQSNAILSLHFALKQMNKHKLVSQREAASSSFALACRIDAGKVFQPNCTFSLPCHTGLLLPAQPESRQGRKEPWWGSHLI